MNEKKELHVGHRDRLRKRFETEGLEKFSDHQVVEMLLFYGIPRKDTNETAHRLLNCFGSLTGIFEAPVESLQKCGISYNAAILLKLIPAVCLRYYQDKYSGSGKEYRNKNNESISDFILTNFIGKNEENVLILLLDSKGDQLFCDFISKGSSMSSDLNLRKILKLCVQHEASGVVIAHNHPSGVALPSNSDVEMTLKLKKSLRSIGVVLLDHFIVADTEVVAMSELGGCEEIFF